MRDIARVATAALVALFVLALATSSAPGATANPDTGKWVGRNLQGDDSRKVTFTLKQNDEGEYKVRNFDTTLEAYAGFTCPSPGSSIPFGVTFNRVAVRAGKFDRSDTGKHDRDDLHGAFRSKTRVSGYVRTRFFLPDACTLDSEKVRWKAHHR